MLDTLFEFAIALAVAPLIFCWLVDIRNAIGRRRGGETLKPVQQAKQAKPTQQDPKPATKPALRYTSKPTVHRVKEGYPNHLTLKDQAVTYQFRPIGSRPLAVHLEALGLEGKQLNDLKAAELRKLGTQMGIKNAARARKKDLLKAMLAAHGYA